MGTRREIMAGAAALGLAAAAPVQAADDFALFRTGPLSRNRAAAQFQRVATDARWPAVAMMSPEGPRSPADIRGKTLILQLWAEWCTPCLIEAAGLAGLRRRMAGPRFDVLTVLTDSHAKLNVLSARDRLDRVGASGLPVWVEPDGARVLFDAFAVRAGVGNSLPCTLLIDSRGRIRGRSFAAPPANSAAFDRVLAQHRPGPDGKYRGGDAEALMAQVGSVWSTSEGDAFAAALAGGVLNRLAG